MESVEIVRRTFEAYLARDIEVADGLLANGFPFTSPQDDHIDKSAFMQRCFPTADRVVSKRSRARSGWHGRGVVMYEYELVTGERHGNSEFIIVRDGYSPRPTCSSVVATARHRTSAQAGPQFRRHPKPALWDSLSVIAASRSGTPWASTYTCRHSEERATIVKRFLAIRDGRDSSQSGPVQRRPPV